MNKLRGKLRNVIAEMRTALLGMVMAWRRPRYIITVVVAFVIFGTLMSLLTSGTAGVSMMISGGSGMFYNFLGKAFLGLFGVGRDFMDWLVLFLISFLQAMVIGLVALVWRGRKKKYTKSDNAGNVERAGIAAGLAVLGSGCPTCGTTLLMPVITAVVGSGGMALASTISGVLTVAAVVILIFSAKSLGMEAYTLCIEEDLSKKKEEK
ncbi:hypothetical protein IJ096_02765 [Candidatus Saccharibacteria bacterium]|nr:hypothetical protein [Candidatus Saccharibacteria bacterium]